MLALEDLCSVLDLPSEAKYDGTIERVARAVRPLSTSADDDLRIIFRRALFAWLIADGDMHLKNLALLKIAEPGDRHFTSVRMAPLYDAVTTRVFPGFEKDRLALKLNGKDSNLGRKDFRLLAATIGLRAADTEINDVIEQMKQALERIRLPPLPDYGPEGEVMTETMLKISRDRLESFA